MDVAEGEKKTWKTDPERGRPFTSLQWKKTWSQSYDFVIYNYNAGVVSS
jgi:hypothetical protein